MPEIVPPDIAAAINRLLSEAEEAIEVDFEFDARIESGKLASARAALDAAILKHLHGYAEMKAALERIEREM